LRTARPGRHIHKAGAARTRRKLRLARAARGRRRRISRGRIGRFGRRVGTGSSHHTGAAIQPPQRNNGYPQSKLRPISIVYFNRTFFKIRPCVNHSDASMETRSVSNYWSHVQSRYWTVNYPTQLHLRTVNELLTKVFHRIPPPLSKRFLSPLPGPALYSAYSTLLSTSAFSPRRR